MGASGWAYFVPYQADLNQALADLQHDVLARGDFHQCDAWWRDLPFEHFLPPEDLDADELAEYRAAYDHRQALQPPVTREEWLEWNGEAGTHSILDMERIIATIPHQPDWSTYAADPTAWIATSQSRFGSIAPLTDAELLAHLGTLRPTHADILAHADALNNLRSRWQGSVIVVYQDDQPHELYFTGYSGD